MNKYENQMVEILSELKANYGVLSVKAEFEAEGTRMDELLRLVEISRSAQLEITVKIGGCEAIRDLFEAKQIGVQGIVAPMVETAYAASKFVSAKNLVYSSQEAIGVKFLTNLETQFSLENIDSIINSIKVDQGLDGLVFGRVDFVGSLGLNRAEVNSKAIREAVSIAARKLSEVNLELVVGGAVSMESLSFLRSIAQIHLSRFETRKVIFSADSLNFDDIEKGLLHAVHFELLWLLNKKEYYGQIHREDDRRIEMLESRWNILKNAKF